MGGEFVTRLISEVPIFSVFVLFFAKATCRLQAFHLSEVQGNRIEIYNRNVVKIKQKGQISSSIKYGHENLAK